MRCSNGQSTRMVTMVRVQDDRTQMVTMVAVHKLVILRNLSLFNGACADITQIGVYCTNGAYVRIWDAKP